MGFWRVTRFKPWMGKMACAIVIADSEQSKTHVTEGGRIICMGSSELGDYRASDTKLCALVNVESVNMVVTMLCAELNLGAHYRCRARACNLYMFSFFQFYSSNNWFLRNLTCLNDSHSARGRAFVVTGSGRCTVHVLQVGCFIKVGSSRCRETLNQWHETWLTGSALYEWLG